MRRPLRISVSGSFLAALVIELHVGGELLRGHLAQRLAVDGDDEIALAQAGLLRGLAFLAAGVNPFHLNRVMADG